jgi:hypothetical protein
MTAKTFEEKLKENPDSFDSVHCRPGPANLSAEYSDRLSPDYVKELLAKGKGEGPMSHRVMVDENFRYQDPESRWTRGTFDTAEEALAACRKMVDDDLMNLHQPAWPRTRFSRDTELATIRLLIPEQAAHRIRDDAAHHSGMVSPTIPE